MSVTHPVATGKHPVGTFGRERQLFFVLVGEVAEKTVDQSGRHPHRLVTEGIMVATRVVELHPVELVIGHRWEVVT